MFSKRYLGCLRWFVFVLNFLFWVAGLGVLGVALWLLFDSDVAHHMVKLDSHLHQFYVTVYILLGVGVLMSLLGFMGCCGAWRKSRCLLISFFTLLVLVFVAELTCGILAYSHQEQIKQYIERSMYDTVHHHYYREKSYTDAFDAVQLGLHCCGVKNYQDWLTSYYATANLGPPELGIGSGTVGRVPHSCCNALGIREDGENCGVSYDKLPLITYEPYLNIDGCLEAVYNKFYHYLDVVIGLAVGIGCFQLLGIILTILLCCCIDEKQKQMRSESY